MNQIDDRLEEIQVRIERGERTLVTTLTKRMAEELDAHLQSFGVRSAYIHSDVDTLDRIRILNDLREGTYDVLIGVNLLREGLDLPEVSLVAILDADKEGFLRNHRSLTQTAGRAARNVNGMVIMYADKITDSMQKTIDETERRRAKQMLYNEQHGITPTPIVKKTNTDLIDLYKGTTEDSNHFAPSKPSVSKPGSKKNTINIPKPEPRAYVEEEHIENALVADPVVEYMSASDLKARIAKVQADMTKAAKAMDFMEAARLRDELLALKDLATAKETEDHV